jgi:hypothetical protein
MFSTLFSAVMTEGGGVGKFTHGIAAVVVVGVGVGVVGLLADIFLSILQRLNY